MKTPERIQRKRTKGWKQPENTCYCGRGSKWGNMFAVELWGLERSLRMYKNTLDTCVETGALDLTELLKYDYLSCWCPLDQKCHVDIIINKLKEYRYFKCNKCGAEYIIKGDYVGCCAMPATYRTSGICGGELIEIQKIKQ